MASDKKRKHSREEGSIESSSVAARVTEAAEVNEALTSDMHQERLSKKAKKDSKKEKKDKKQNKEVKDKKEKKEKKEKKDKKEKKEKKVKNGPAEPSNSKSLKSIDTLDMRMDLDSPMAVVAKTEVIDIGVQIKVQKKQAVLAHEVDIKQTKKAKKEEISKAASVLISKATSANVSTTADSSDSDSSETDRESDESVTKEQTGAGSSTSTPVDLSGLTRKERKLLKIKQRQLNRKSEGDGEPAFKLKEGHELTLTELRDLVVFILTETPSLPWIQVLNKFKIDKVLMLYVSGLDPGLFHMNIRSSDAHKPIAWAQRADTHGGPVSEFEHLREYFENVNVVKATGDKFKIYSPTNTLLQVPLSNSEKVKRDKERRDQKSGKKLKPENYIMSLEELRVNHFPIPSYLDEKASELPKDWIETSKLNKTTLTPPPKTMIAMDCEMCRTTAGPELTRVSLVDHNGTVILDELVMPENPILDYLTQYSGMTAAKLEGVTTRLADAQEKVSKIVDYNTILVGHSLENDMQVLKLAHPFVIDTSLIYHHTRGPPYRPGLKWLAQKWLQRQIQHNAERGHDSAEDALTCMDLTKLKLSKPVGFGEYAQDHESLFSRLQRYNNPRTSALIGPDAFAGQSATAVTQTTSDKEVVQAIPEAIREHNFVWARLGDIQLNHGKVPKQILEKDQVADTGRDSKVSSADKIQASEEEIRAGIRSVDKSIQAIFESLPARTAVIVTSGQGDHREVSKMQQRQKAFQDLLKKTPYSEIKNEDKFSPEEQRKLEEAVEKAKSGICFFAVKK